MKWGEAFIIERERYRLMGDNEWRSWFAWYPVRVEDGTKVWREPVEFNQPMKYNVPRYRLPRGPNKHLQGIDRAAAFLFSASPEPPLG